MYPKAAYTLVGFFVVVFGAGMVWFAFWLSHATDTEVYTPYKLFMKESISGLSKDAIVKLHGVPIGRVTAIEIDPNQIELVEISFVVESKIPLKEDMFATTQMVGVTGMLIIEIDGGTNEARTLLEGESLQTKPSLLSTITNHAKPLLKEIHTLVKKSNQFMSSTQAFVSPQNAQNISKILLSVAGLTSRIEEIEKRFFDSLDEVDSTLKESRVLMEIAKPILIQASEDFHLVSHQSVSLIKDTKKTVKGFSKMIKKIDKSLVRGDYNMKKIFAPMLIDIQVLLRQVSHVSRQLEQNPSDFLFKSRSQRKAPGE